MKKKIFLAGAVFAFSVFSVAWAYSGYGKKASENMEGTPDGKALVCRKFAEISKVLVIDYGNKSHKKEVTGWNYDVATGGLTVREDLSAFAAPSFHIEGKPVEPAEFILHNQDSGKGPVAVFLNGKVAVENREYVFNEGSKTLMLKVPAKEVSSFSVIWHTADGGLSSTNEISEKESDLYAELKGDWFTQNAKKQLMAETEYPALEFPADTGNGAGAGTDTTPRVVMKQYTDAERRELVDSFPVSTNKYRRNKSMNALSKEAGFTIDLPKKSGAYKIVSTLLIESALKGEKTKSMEVSYDTSGAFTFDSINIEVRKADESAVTAAETVAYPISSETLAFKVPVKKQVLWAIGSTLAADGNFAYTPEKYCTYTWTNKGSLYTVQCPLTKAAETEAFLKALF